MARKNRTQFVMSTADICAVYANWPARVAATTSSYTVGASDGAHTVVRWVAGQPTIVARLATEREATARAIALQAAR